MGLRVKFAIPTRWVLIIQTKRSELSENFESIAGGERQAVSEVPLQWRVHLLMRSRQSLPLLLLTLLFADVCVWFIFGAWMPVLAATLLLLGSVRDYLFPLSYTLDDEKATATGFLTHATIRWSEVKRVAVGKPGILLSPYAEPSRLDSFRGILLRPAPVGLPCDRATLLVEIAKLREQAKDAE